MCKNSKKQCLEGFFDHVKLYTLSSVLKGVWMGLVVRATNLILNQLSGNWQRRATRGSESTLSHSAGHGGIHSATDFITHTSQLIQSETKVNVPLKQKKIKTFPSVVLHNMRLAKKSYKNYSCIFLIQYLQLQCLLYALDSSMQNPTIEGFPVLKRFHTEPLWNDITFNLSVNP